MESEEDSISEDSHVKETYMPNERQDPDPEPLISWLTRTGFIAMNTNWSEGERLLRAYTKSMQKFYHEHGMPAKKDPSIKHYGPPKHRHSLIMWLTDIYTNNRANFSRMWCRSLKNFRHRPKSMRFDI